jgi:hypothetical protein
MSATSKLYQPAKSWHALAHEPTRAEQSALDVADPDHAYPLYRAQDRTRATRKTFEQVEAKYQEILASNVLQQAYPNVPWARIKLINRTWSRVSMADTKQHTLYLAKGSSNLILLHELAHFVVPAAGHAPPYPSVLLHLIELTYDAAAADVLAARFDQHEISYERSRA